MKSPMIPPLSKYFSLSLAADYYFSCCCIYSVSYDKIGSLSVKDDPDLFDYNVQERVNAFVAAALDQVRFGECSFFFTGLRFC